MKGLRVVAMALIAVAIAGIVAQEVQAETRTLTTTLLVTVRPKTPEAPNAPQQVQDLLASALTQSQNERYITADLPAGNIMDGQRYTLVERL